MTETCPIPLGGTLTWPVDRARIDNFRVAADWHEEHGDGATATALRSLWLWADETSVSVQIVPHLPVRTVMDFEGHPDGPRAITADVHDFRLLAAHIYPPSGDVDHSSVEILVSERVEIFYPGSGLTLRLSQYSIDGRRKDWEWSDGWMSGASMVAPGLWLLRFACGYTSEFPELPELAAWRRELDTLFPATITRSDPATPSAGRSRTSPAGPPRP